MKKSDLIDEIATSAKITKSQANVALNTFTSSIASSLKKDGVRITLTGFGTFSTVKRKARAGRNPKTGETIKIPASRTPKFTPGKTLKDAVR